MDRRYFKFSYFRFFTIKVGRFHKVESTTPCTHLTWSQLCSTYTVGVDIGNPANPLLNECVLLYMYMFEPGAGPRSAIGRAPDS